MGVRISLASFPYVIVLRPHAAEYVSTLGAITKARSVCVCVCLLGVNLQKQITLRVLCQFADGRGRGDRACSHSSIGYSVRPITERPWACPTVVYGRAVRNRGYGATAARLTPDQKVGSSNLSGLISICECFAVAFRRIYVYIKGAHLCENGQFLRLPARTDFYYATPPKY